MKYPSGSMLSALIHIQAEAFSMIRRKSSKQNIARQNCSGSPFSSSTWLTSGKSTIFSFRLMPGNNLGGLPLLQKNRALLIRWQIQRMRQSTALEQFPSLFFSAQKNNTKHLNPFPIVQVRLFSLRPSELK